MQVHDSNAQEGSILPKHPRLLSYYSAMRISGYDHPDISLN